jgi:hypothetical protein
MSRIALTTRSIDGRYLSIVGIDCLETFSCNTLLLLPPLPVNPLLLGQILPLHPCCLIALCLNLRGYVAFITDIALWVTAPHISE